MSVIGAFKDKDNNRIFPLSSASIKLDYVNSVDLSNIESEYTIPNDGELVTDSGCVVVNKGNIVRNTDKEYIIYIPYRHSCILPEETTASNIKCNDSEGELSTIQTVVDSTEDKLEALTNKVGEVPQGTNVEAQITQLNTDLTKSARFINTVIQNPTAATEDTSYTATQDCWFLVYGTEFALQIDGMLVAGVHQSNATSQTSSSAFVPLKNGQTARIARYSAGFPVACNYGVYSMQ